MSTYDAWKAGEIGGNDRDPRSPAYDPRGDEARAKFVAEFKANPANIAQACEWTDGEMSGAHYTETQQALYALHHGDASDLSGSDRLATLYRLAKERAAVIDAWLDSQAQQAWELHVEAWRNAA